MKRSNLSRHSLCGLFSILAISACAFEENSRDPAAQPAERKNYAADIRYAGYGIPHVLADDFGGAGYGAGYAYAEDNLCISAELAVTLRGDRSRHFGADAFHSTHFVLFNSNQDDPSLVNNFESDAYFRYYYTEERIDFVRNGASPDAQALLAGFVAGFNRRLAEHKAAGDGPDCVTSSWIGELTEDDMYRRALNVTILYSADPFKSAMVNAKPPVPEPANLAVAQSNAGPSPSRLPTLHRNGRTGGSNAMAFGRDATENGKALVFSNPHFPWRGTERQYAMHLTVGDDYDVFGSTLLGLPVPLIGWNDSMAWSITYSTDTRVAVYKLRLNPEDPTQYQHGDEYRSMQQTVVSVPIEEGGTREVTIYETVHGPVIAGGPFAWSKDAAYAIMDFSVGNNRMIDTFLDVGRAEDVRQVERAMEDTFGVQFSNLVAGDDSGEVLYSNFSIAANYSDEKLERCFVPQVGAVFFEQAAVPVLEGTDECMPDLVTGSLQPDAVPADRRPSLIRTDYVTNTNDSHWIVTGDPAARLEGYQRTVGTERTTRGERTRASIAMAEDRLAGRDGLPGDKMSSELFLELFYAGHNATAELIVDDLVAGCREEPSVEIDGETVDLRAACEVLDSWNRRNAVDSKGAGLFEVFMQMLPSEPTVDHRIKEELWAVAFDPARPLETPRGIQVTAPVRDALGRSVKMLSENGIELDVPFGEMHGSRSNGDEYYGLPGGRITFHAISPEFVEGSGYTGHIPYGNSFMFLVSFGDSGPVAKFVLAYSQGTDPDSSHRSDQYEHYATGDWIRMPYSAQEIQASPNYRSVRISQ